MAETDKYTTPLRPEQVLVYQQWKNKYAPKDSGQDYDLQGAFTAGLTPDPKTGHWKDTYKKPNHPTFSNQSKYAVGEDANYAGRWEGETYIPPTIRKKDIPEIKAILAGEGANDPLGWDALLNTYAKDIRPGETLVEAMRRNSSAFKSKSIQYKKYLSGQLTGLEKIVDMGIDHKVRNFKPNSKWEYTYHESPTANKAYHNDPNKMIEILKQKWGNNVDFTTPIKIGRQYYFKKSQPNKSRIKALKKGGKK